MNLDKDDLLRNALPGYVFLIVILSFYAAANRLDSLNEVHSALLGIVAGYPLGFVIQAIYRILFHVGSGEQERIEVAETEIIPKEFRTAIERRIDARRPPHEIFSQWLAISLSHHDNRPFKERSDFLMSYVHSLGGSCLAIFLALAFMCLVKIHYFGLCQCSKEFLFQTDLTTNLWNLLLFQLGMLRFLVHLLLTWSISLHCPVERVFQWLEIYKIGSSLSSFLICMLIWIGIAIVLFIGRHRTLNHAYRTSRDLFIRLAKLDEGNSWLLKVRRETP